MATRSTTPEYQNNPFFVAIDGIKLLFKHALSVAIFLIVLAVLASSSQSVSTVVDIQNGVLTNTPEEQQAQDKAAAEAFMSTVSHLTSQEWAAIAMAAIAVLLIVMIVGVIIGGINDYTAAQLAKNKQTTLGEALKAVIARFPSYLWLHILIGIKVLLWSLLFIIPGIIMSVRYSLAGTAFFHDNKRGNNAIKYSLALTKGAWLTTFASLSFFNLITFGLLQPILQPGIQAVLYRQYTAYDTTKMEKPAAHGLSWFALFLPFILFAFLIALVFVAIFAFVALAPETMIP